MRFSTYTTACLITAASASTHLIPRDLSAVKVVLSQVTDKVNTLDKAVTSFNGSIQPVIAAAEDLTSTLQNGTKTVDNTEALDSSDAFALLTPIYALQTQGETLASDLKCQRPAIEKNHLCGQTRQQVTQINSASETLVKAAISKIPKGLQSLSTDLSQTLTDSLQSVQEYFAEGNCTDGGGGGHASTGSSCSAASASTASTSPSSTTSVTPSSSAVPKDGAALTLLPAGFLATAAVSFMTAYAFTMWI